MIGLPPISGLTIVSHPSGTLLGDRAVAPVPPPKAASSVSSTPPSSIGDTVNPVAEEKLANARNSPQYFYDTLTGQMVMEFLNAKSGAPELQIPDSATLRERAASIASYRPADPEPK